MLKLFNTLHSESANNKLFYNNIDSVQLNSFSNIKDEKFNPFIISTFQSIEKNNIQIQAYYNSLNNFEKGAFNFTEFNSSKIRKKDFNRKIKSYYKDNNEDFLFDIYEEDFDQVLDIVYNEYTDSDIYKDFITVSDFQTHSFLEIEHFQLYIGIKDILVSNEVLIKEYSFSLIVRNLLKKILSKRIKEISAKYFASNIRLRLFESLNLVNNELKRIVKETLVLFTFFINSLRYFYEQKRYKEITISY